MKTKKVLAYKFLGPLILSSLAVAANENDIQTDTRKRACDAMATDSELNTFQRVSSDQLRRIEGELIGDIDVRVFEVFDESNPAENNALYRLANNIHITTQPDVIRDQLLFQSGDRVDVEAIQESVRLLYDREYLLDVVIRPVRKCGDRVDLVVLARDSWVLDPKVSYGREGGEEKTGYGLRDGNFLGSGDDVEVVYRKEADREKIIYRYKTNHFAGRRLDAELYHADSSDGDNYRVRIEKPFFSLGTKYSYGVDVFQESLEYNTRYQDEVINEFNMKTFTQEVFWGKSIGYDRDQVDRVLVGYTDTETTFNRVMDTTQIPEDNHYRYAWLEWQHQTNRYQAFVNLNDIARTEDLQIGTNYRLRAGYGEDANGSHVNVLEGEVNHVLSVSDHHLLTLESTLQAVYQNQTKDVKDTVVSVEASYHYFLNHHQRWYMSLAYDYGDNLSENNELTLGEKQGLRGYPLAYQRGEQRYLATLEHRYYSDAHWFNLIRVGGAAFVDVGRAWGNKRYDNDKTLVSAGVGLRFQSSKSGDPTVLHVNLAAPLTNSENVDNYMLSVTMKNTF